MSAKAFFDTNIIVYTQRTDAPDKTRIAENALAHFEAMVAAALHTECTYLFSEDMQDGLIIEGTLTIVNILVHTDLLQA
jgi:predicted nucleic acid-binding protein